MSDGDPSPDAPDAGAQDAAPSAPAAASDGGPARAGVARVQLIGCPPATEQRLLAALGAAIEDPPEVVVVSTRASVRELPSGLDVPIVALVHPGGSAQARRFLEAGATACVPEGREDLVAAVVGADADGSLTDPLRQLLDAPPPPDALPAAVAAVIGVETDANRRLLVVEVPALGALVDRVGTGVTALVRARVERALSTVTPTWAPLSVARYVAALEDLRPEDVPGLAASLDTTVGLLRGLEHDGTAVHVGHAGAEDATDPRIQLDLAEAACDLAATERRVDVSVPDVLERRSLPEAAEVLLDLADAADERSPDDAPSRLVAEVAAGLAAALEWDHEEIDVARLAGRLHAVASVGSPEDADDATRQARLRARLVGLDPRVVEAIDRHAEPAGDDGPPEAARLLAVALAVAGALHRGEPVAAVGGSAAGLDAELVELAIARFAVPEPDAVAATG